MVGEVDVLGLGGGDLKRGKRRSLLFVDGLLLLIGLVLDGLVSFLILHRSLLALLLFFNFLSPVRTETELVRIVISRKTRGKEKGITSTDIVQIELRLLLLSGLLLNSFFNRLLLGLFYRFLNDLLIGRLIGGNDGDDGFLLGIGNLQIFDFGDGVDRGGVRGSLVVQFDSGGLELLGLLGSRGFSSSVLGRRHLLSGHFRLYGLLLLQFPILSTGSPSTLETGNGGRNGLRNGRRGLGTVHFVLGDLLLRLLWLLGDLLHLVGG